MGNLFKKYKSKVINNGRRFLSTMDFFELNLYKRELQNFNPLTNSNDGTDNDLILWLDANTGKTGNPISQWNDRSQYVNNATQSTVGLRPADNTTYVTFASDAMTCISNTSLNLTHALTYYAKMRTTSITNFLGLIDKFVNASGGAALFLDTSKRAAITAQFSKTTVSLSGTTAVNDNNIYDIHGTVNCSKKWINKRYICDGEEPSILKEGNTYYMFYDRWDGAQYNIYYRSDTSPYFENSSEILLISNVGYCQVWKDGATYRMVCTDNASHNILLYTSATVNSGYALQGTLVTFGAAYDAVACADPHEIKIGSTYYIYYSAFSAVSTGTIAYATSATGAVGSYTKNGTCVANGTATDFDKKLCADPDVKLLPDNTTYIMFYTGYNDTYLKQTQGYATSTDGITWSKFSGNPIHYFQGESYEVGTYGPNEPFFLLENGIWRCWYRSRNDVAASFKIGYFEFNADTNNLPICGNESIISKIYVNGALQNTSTITGTLGIDYIPATSQDVFIGGDNVSTLYFVGDIYEAKIWNTIKIQ